MQLFLNTTSPYARVARIAALEKGLADRVELIWCDPWSDDAALLAVNPVGRVPALTTDDGTALVESPLIAMHLDAVGQGPDLVPGAQQSEVLHRAGLGQGLMEAAFNSVIGRKHHGAAADDSVLGQRRARAIARTLAALDNEVITGGDKPGNGGTVTLGDIAVAVALDYLLFRMPEIDWQPRHPALADWHEAVIARESFRTTRFQ